MPSIDAPEMKLMKPLRRVAQRFHQLRQPSSIS